jgi:hypothetical protein
VVDVFDDRAVGVADGETCACGYVVRRRDDLGTGAAEAFVVWLDVVDQQGSAGSLPRLSRRLRSLDRIGSQVCRLIHASEGRMGRGSQA